MPPCGRAARLCSPRCLDSIGLCLQPCSDSLVWQSTTYQVAMVAAEDTADVQYLRAAHSQGTGQSVYQHLTAALAAGLELNPKEPASVLETTLLQCPILTEPRSAARAPDAYVRCRSGVETCSSGTSTACASLAASAGTTWASAAQVHAMHSSACCAIQAQGGHVGNMQRGVILVMHKPAAASCADVAMWQNHQIMCYLAQDGACMCARMCACMHAHI